MAANNISTLATKQARQKAKLEAASAKRKIVNTVGYRPLNKYDINLLPTQYSGNTIIDNPNQTGLQLGRPWITP